MNLEGISSTVQSALTRAGLNHIAVGFTTGGQNARDVVASFEDGHLNVVLYPTLVTVDSFRAVKAVVTEIGRAIAEDFTPSNQQRFRLKMVKANKDSVTQFQSLLSSGQHQTFSAIIQAIPRAVDRLIAVHLANALLASNQSVKLAANLNVMEWGPTAELASGTKPFSLIPLVSAYAPAEVYRDYGCALADYVLNALESIGESSVRYYYSDLVAGLTRRPAV